LTTARITLGSALSLHGIGQREMSLTGVLGTYRAMTRIVARPTSDVADLAVKSAEIHWWKTKFAVSSVLSDAYRHQAPDPRILW
jgi:hypothetical protein